MKTKKMYLIPVLLGTLLAGCTIVDKNELYKKNDTSNNNTGKFAVRVDNDGTSLGMAPHSDSQSTTEFMEATNIPSFTGAFSYKWFSEDKGFAFSSVHNEYSESLMGKSSLSEGLGFYKYTFFLKNKEQEEVNYYIDINLIDSDKTGINEYIRVMLFEGTNKQTVFAKRSKTNSSGKEFLNSNNESLGEAEIFDGTNITGISSSIDADENRMITLLFWLEGDDPECKDVPDNVLLNVEANIRGYKS